MALAVLFGGTSASGSPSPKEKTGQKEPTRERVLEIQKALNAHGHPVEVTGKWDEQTKSVMFKWQDSMGWQVNHVPDARVINCIGLGGAHADLSLCSQRGNHLDEAQRHEKDSEN